MAVIQKSNETMTAKERVLKTFNLERTDRVTIGYEANPAIHSRVAEAIGCAPDDMEGVLRALGVDYRGVGVPYVGRMLFEEMPGRRTDPVDGFRMRWVENQSGGYWDFCDFPLKNADPESIANYPVPSPDDFDYNQIGEQLDAFRDSAIYIGNPGIPDVINSTGRIMGMEDTLCNLVIQDEATLTFINRRMDLKFSVMEQLLKKYGPQIDFVWLGEDLGSQYAPLISLELYQAVLKPVHKRFVDLANAYGKPVLVHTCGSSSWVYEDFIEMGVRGVDTLQPEAKNMNPQYLKEHFGGRLCFRGCISTAGPLAYGSALNVTENCRETLNIMMKDYGYHFAPTHAIQDNTPTENVLAMYQAAHDFGVY